MFNFQDSRLCVLRGIYVKSTGSLVSDYEDCLIYSEYDAV